MKKLKNIYILLLLGTALLSGCKKTSTQITTSTDDSSTQELIASDELKVNSEMDQAIDEAIAGLCICKPTSGSATINPYTIPGAVIDTSQVNSGIVNIYYYGKEADTTKTRGGSIEITLPVISKNVTPWITKGVIATITFTKYEIFYNAKNKTTLWFNGSFTITNTSGGLLNSLAVGDSLTEKVNGPISYTDNDNAVVLQLFQWHFCKTRVFNHTATDTTLITTRGDTTAGGFVNVSNWGQTRFVQNYYTSITRPIVRNTNESIFYNPLRGAKIIHGIPEPITDTLGVNSYGIPAGNNIPYGYKINWANSAGSQMKVITY